MQWIKYVKHNNTEYETYNVTAGLHVSTLTESSSGPHDTDPYNECIVHSLYGSVSCGPEDDSVRVETCNPAVTLYVSYSVLLRLTDIFYPLYSINISGWKTSDLYPLNIYESWYKSPLQ